MRRNEAYINLEFIKTKILFTKEKESPLTRSIIYNISVSSSHVIPIDLIGLDDNSNIKISTVYNDLF